jgi:pimeloyl-ACP methyl ester carboxylesterase
MKLPISVRILRRTLSLLSIIAPTWVAQFWAERFITPTRHPRPGWEQEILKDAHSQTVLDAIKIWTWEGTGPTVFLVHGWDGRGSQLGKFVAPLRAAGYRVMTWDGPAHGDSKGAQTILPLTAQALLEVSKLTGPYHAVIAHSFGGGCSAFAVQEGLQTKNLILIGSPGSIQGIFDRYTGWAKISTRSRTAFQKILEDKTGYQVSDLEMGGRPWTMPIPRTLVVHAPNDFDVPFHEAEDLVRRWPGAEMLVRPELGHRRILKDPETIGMIIAFIQKN